jgi:hypothetical protein
MDQSDKVLDFLWALRQDRDVGRSEQDLNGDRGSTQAQQSANTRRRKRQNRGWRGESTWHRLNCPERRSSVVSIETWSSDRQVRAEEQAEKVNGNG